MSPTTRLRSTVTVIAALAFGAAGCSEPEKSLRERVAECAQLPGARASIHPELRVELDAIIADGQTPARLSELQVADDENVAAAMATIFDRTLLKSILSTANQIYPKDGFTFSTVELKRAKEFRDNHQRRLDAVVAALARPECDFGIEFDKGYFFEEQFVDEAAIACRLLAFDAAVELSKNGPAAAIVPLSSHFQLVRHLADAKLLTARVRAARLRSDALDVLAAIAAHPDATTENLRSLERLVTQQLAAWPSDADSLIGERAMVMHSYEAIRLGLLRWILTTDEVETFREERVLNTLDAALREKADSDEAFYLRSIRRLIEASDRPYHERTETYARLTEDLRAVRAKPEFPFAAARLFLPGIEDSQREMALDRARCEAWAIALGVAIDGKSTPYEKNPYNGESYATLRESHRVVVSLGADDDPIAIVPLPASDVRAARR